MPVPVIKLGTKSQEGYYDHYQYWKGLGCGHNWTSSRNCHLHGVTMQFMLSQIG